MLNHMEIVSKMVHNVYERVHERFYLCDGKAACDVKMDFCGSEGPFSFLKLYTKQRNRVSKGSIIF